jgi:hypothetical protein
MFMFRNVRNIAGRRRKRINEQWGLLAKELNAKFTEQTLIRYPKVEGTYRNHSFQIFTKGGSQYSPPFTVISVSTKEKLKDTKKVKFSIIPRGRFSRKKRGMNIGNPDFIEKFLVKGNIPETHSWNLLEPKLQKKIMEFGKEFNFMFKKGKGLSTLKNICDNSEKMKVLMDINVDVLDELEKKCLNTWFHAL